MNVLVIVDGSPAWSVSSLQGAMELAEQYALEGHYIELVSRHANALRTWHFDHPSRGWVERVLHRAASRAAPNAEHRLAA